MKFINCVATLLFHVPTLEINICSWFMARLQHKLNAHIHIIYLRAMCARKYCEFVSSPQRTYLFYPSIYLSIHPMKIHQRLKKKIIFNNIYVKLTRRPICAAVTQKEIFTWTHLARTDYICTCAPNYIRNSLKTIRKSNCLRDKSGLRANAP